MFFSRCLRFIIILPALLIFSLPTFAQDSLEVNMLSKYFADFDSMQKLYRSTYYYYMIVDHTNLQYAHYGRFGEIDGYHTITTPDTIHSISPGHLKQYLANDDEGLTIVRSSMNIVSFPQYGKCFDVKTIDNTVFITTDSGFYILDAEDYENPELLSSYTDGSGYRELILDGNYAYFTSTDQELHVVNIENYSLIQHVGNVPLNREIDVLYIHNNLLFALSETEGIYIYSLEDPESPTLLNHPEYPVGTYNMAVRNDTAWVCCRDALISFLDISDIENITELGSYRINAKWLVLEDDNHLTVNTNNEYCTVLDIQNPDSIYSQSYYGNNHIVDFYYDDYYAFACDDRCGFYSMDVTYPWYMGAYLPFEVYPSRRVVLKESKGAFITTDNKVKLIDPRNAGWLGILSTIELDAKGTDLDISDNILTLSLENGGLQNYDISDSTTPYLVSEITDEINANGIYVENGTVYMAGANGELTTYDISNPTQTPVLNSSLSIANTCYEVLIHQGFAFVACGEEGIKIVDFYDPANPELVTTIDTDGTAYDITIGGWYFYIADGLNGVRVYDIHSPYEPQLVGYYDTPGNATRVFAWHENCGVVDEDQFLILRYAYATDTPEIESKLPSEFRIDSVYPNPFNPNCNVKINIPESGLMSLKVYNTLGQEVSSLSETPVKAGSFEYQFFGKNQASGVYILKVELEGYGVQTAKMVLMK